MKIAVGCDHGGFELKNQLVEYLGEKRYQVIDFGTYSKESCDYPLIGEKVALSVSKGESGKGILICKSGIGICIVANKFPKVRAAMVYNTETAKLSRQHNDANIIVLGAEFTPFEEAEQILDVWFNTEFEGGRHKRRVNQIIEIEKRLYK